MILSAAAASSGLTAMRRSQDCSLSASGKTVRELSLSIADGMSCVSSRPRITLASISDGVRKMTTSSWLIRPSHRHPGGADERFLDLDENHRHVVVLIGGADE